MVLIVGASAGIGRALADEFARNGHRLIIVARRREPLVEAATELAARNGVEVHALALDITCADSADEIAKLAAGKGLYIDTVVLNAALWAAGPLTGLERGELRRIVETNISAVCELAVALLPAMLARGRGNILITGSLAGEGPSPFNAVYAASKAFLRSWTLSLRYEAAEHGINVSLLAPGVVDTDFTHTATQSFADRGRRFLAATPAAAAWVAYRGLMSGQAIIVPGLMWRIVRRALQIMPDRLIAQIRGRLAARNATEGAGR